MVREVGNNKQPGHVQSKQPVNISRQLSETVDAVGAFPVPMIPAGSSRRKMPVSKNYPKDTARDVSNVFRSVFKSVSSKRSGG